MATGNDILSIDDIKIEQVDLADIWNKTVYISEMSADMLDQYEQYMYETQERRKNNDTKYRKHVRAALAIATLIDKDTKKPLFEFTQANIEAMGKKNAKALDRIFDAANKLNKLFGAERAEIKKKSETQNTNDAGE